jgi:hypothetical protein
MSKLITIQPPAMRELSAALPRAQLLKQKYFKGLKPNEQETLFSATKGVMHSLAAEQVGLLGQGFYLAQGQAILAPSNGKRKKDQSFGKWLRNFRMTQRTAYRKIAAYKNAKEHYPDTVLTAAMARGMTIASHSTTRPLGQFQEIVKTLPPPKNPSPEKANEYLDQLNIKLKERRQRTARKDKKDEKQATGDPAMLLKMSYRSLSVLAKRLPSRSKRAWLDSVTGMMMTLLGISTGQRFEPCAIPEDFQPKRGRPSLVKEEETDKTKVAS